LGLKQLIQKCKNNDTKAQSELYHLYSRTLFAICLKYSRNREEAQDVLHDAFITIFNKINQFKHKGSFEGWIKRITVNTALQRYRDKSFLEVVNEETLKDEEVEINEDEIELDFLLQCVQQLPDRYRLVFSMYVLDGYSHKQIAQILEITTGTSKSNLSRARLILKEKIENYKANLNSQL